MLTFQQHKGPQFGFPCYHQLGLISITSISFNEDSIVQFNNKTWAQPFTDLSRNTHQKILTVVSLNVQCNKLKTKKRQGQKLHIAFTNQV